MPDFSGASLKLKAEGEDKLLATLDKVDRKARETVGGWGRLTQSEVDKASAAFDQLYGKQSKAARQTQAVVEDVSNKVDAAMNRTGRGVLAASRAIEVIGRTGKEAGRSLDTLLTQVSYLAFGFGSAGAIVAAVGITTAAIIEMFNRVEREHEKARASMLKTLEDIGHARSRLRAQEEMDTLKSGDPFALRGSAGHEHETDDEWIARSKGIDGLTDRVKALNSEVAKMPKMGIAAYGNLGSGSHSAINPAAKDRTDEISAITDQLKLLNEGYERAKKLRDQFFDKPPKGAGDYYGKTDPYRRTENETVGAGGLDPLHREFARLEAQIPDPLRAFSDKLKADNEADAFAIRETVDHTLKAALKPLEDVQHAAEEKAKEFGRVIANGITAGLQSIAKDGIGGAFKALTQSVLNGLGNMMAEIAEKALIASHFMQELFKLLPTNPWAAAAVAVAMYAFAQSIGGLGRGGGGGGGSSSSYSGSSGSVIDRGIINPTAPTGNVTSASSISARPSSNFYTTIVGVNDPSAQRQMQELIRKANARGDV